MTYFHTDKYCQLKLNAERFARDLCEALGAGGYESEDFTAAARIYMAPLRLYLRQGYGAGAKRVTISSGIADSEIHRRAYSRRSNFNFPEITVDPDRPMAALAKDIRKRVIDASAGPLAAMLEAEKQASELASGVRQHAERIAAAFPTASVTIGDDTKTEAGFYLNHNGVYLSGRINSSGALYVDRLGTVPPDKLDALLALLTS